MQSIHWFKAKFKFQLNFKFNWAIFILSGWMPIQAQERVWRCGNEYTNNPASAQNQQCKIVEGGNLTVVQSPKPRPLPLPLTLPSPTTPHPSLSSTSSSSPSSGQPPSAYGVPSNPIQRPSTETARSRDQETRLILETELRKAQETLQQARFAYANGQPEKQGIEFRNHQLYLDRVAQLRTNVTRAEGDVTSLQRELARLSGGNGNPSNGRPLQ